MKECEEIKKNVFPDKTLDYLFGKEEVEMKLILACITCSAITSIVVTKILATHYFEIVDGYVNNIVIATKEFIESIKSMECKQKQTRDQDL